MATPTCNRAFQVYNNHSFINRPTIKKSPSPTTIEPSASGYIPYSNIKTTTEQVPSVPPSPSSTGSFKHPTGISKQRPSIVSMANLLPRRKSLQMTALAEQRQSLWVNLAKNPQTTQTQVPSFPLRQQQQSNLLRKKLLRLLLVFSYLLSISLFAIALATFYGFFWSGYSTTSRTSIPPPNIEITVTSITPLTSNSTFIDIGVSIGDVSYNE